MNYFFGFFFFGFALIIVSGGSGSGTFNSARNLANSVSSCFRTSAYSGLLVNARQFSGIGFQVEQLPVVDLGLVEVHQLVAVGDHAVVPTD